MNRPIKSVNKSKTIMFHLGSKMYFAVVFCTLAVLFLNGCGKKKTNPIEIKPEVQVPSGSPEQLKPKQPEQIMTNFTARVEAFPDPNKYFVDLTWNIPLESKNLFISRKVGEEVAKKISETGERITTFRDVDVTPGNTYKYFLNQGNTKGEVTVNEVFAEVPKDLEIHEVSKERNLTQFNRIFFFNGGKLVTAGASIQLRANEVISKSGSIETFSSSSKGFPGVNGRSGGDIEIEINKLNGDLNIVGNGEGAGDGVDGSTGRNGNQGSIGQPGQWGMNPELYKYLLKNFVDSFKIHMERFKPPYTDPEWGFSLGGMKRYVCASAPTGGSNGENGLPGGDGGDAGRGGDSAKIYVRIKESSNSKVSILGEAGRGGLGGRPGIGGSGGAGGEPGDLDLGHLCSPANKGPAGAKGIDGHQGRVGEPGKRQPTCLRIADQNYYDCNLFTEVKNGNTN